MPKKKNNKSKSDKEKEKVLDELAASLKLSKEERDLENLTEDEGSELEEEISDDGLARQDMEFHQFMKLQEKTIPGAPVLERIAGSVPRPIFVGGMPRGSPSENDGEKNGFNYVAGAENVNEPKYEAPSQLYIETQQSDISKAGRTRDVFSQTGREASFQQDSRVQSSASPMEKPWTAGRVDVERAGRRDPFQKEEEKYIKYKPKFSQG